jgi:hypothetical protein
MAVSLYDISVASYLQTLGAVTGFLDKGASHCAGNDIDLADVVETRLFPDMMPFRFQLVSVAHHSLGAVRGIEAGVFTPPPPQEELDYSGLQALIADTSAELDKLDRGAVDALEGKKVVFRLGDNEIPFTAENFVLSFSLPNFYFHAATAYGILRSKGVPVGKRDFMGRLRMGV